MSKFNLMTKYSNKRLEDTIIFSVKYSFLTNLCSQCEKNVTDYSKACN